MLFFCSIVYGISNLSINFVFCFVCFAHLFFYLVYGRWDTGEIERMSPWDLQPVAENGEHINHRGGVGGELEAHPCVLLTQHLPHVTCCSQAKALRTRPQTLLVRRRATFR